MHPQKTPPDSAGRRGVIILTGAALMFSAMALCVKMASRHLPGQQLACMRFIIGLFALVVPLSSGRRLRPVNHAALLLRGLFGGAAVLLYFLAITHLPVGIATLLNSCWPVFVAFLAYLFLNEPLSSRALLALLMTSVGVLLVVLGSTPSLSFSLHTLDGSAELKTDPSSLTFLFWGFIGLCSSMFSAAAVTTVRSMRKQEGSWEIFLAFCLIGSVITAVPSALSWTWPTFEDLPWILGMGIFSVVAQLCMTYALRDVPAITTGIILQLTPVATLLLGMVLFAEHPPPACLFGALLTLGGITISTIVR